MSNDRVHADTPGRRLLRCPVCGRADEVTQDDLMRHARDGWPKCCGQVMAYFMEAPRPAGTRFSHKCSSCGHEWAITFPPGVEPPKRANLICVRCGKAGAPA
jgi:ribosomal protein S14